MTFVNKIPSRKPAQLLLQIPSFRFSHSRAVDNEGGIKGASPPPPTLPFSGAKTFFST